MGEEQGEGPSLHHSHLQSHSLIGEGDVAGGDEVHGQEMLTMRIRLAELQSKYAQQQQVRNPGDICSHLCVLVLFRHSAMLVAIGVCGSEW